MSNFNVVLYAVPNSFSCSNQMASACTYCIGPYVYKPMSQTSQRNQINETSEVSQTSQVSQMSKINQICHTSQISQMTKTSQMGQIWSKWAKQAKRAETSHVHRWVSGFSGKRCETRSSNLCSSVDCSGRGDCFEDYTSSFPPRAECYCDVGYTSGECC
jgi:hypothetical protein